MRGGLVLFMLAAFLLPRGAPATVQEQRKRLPPPAECEDEVAGTWNSHYFFKIQRSWYMFTLEIKRVEGQDNQLTGTITSHFWNGPADEPEPPPCRPGLRRLIVKMPAKGSVENGVVSFGGLSWTLDKTVCGPSYTRYNPDNFSGKIDPEIQEFQSVNNDQGDAVNVPVVFRRTDCPDDDKQEEPPKINVKPPPFQLPKRTSSGGCGCGELGL